MLTIREYLQQLLANPEQINSLPSSSEKYLLQLFFHLYLDKSSQIIIDSKFFDKLEPKELNDVIKELKKQLAIAGQEKNESVVQLFTLLDKNDSTENELKREIILTQILPVLHQLKLAEINDDSTSASLKARLLHEMHTTATFEACIQQKTKFSKTYRDACKVVQKSFDDLISEADAAVANHNVKQYLKSIKTAGFISEHCKDILDGNNAQVVGATKKHFTDTANVLARNFSINLQDLFSDDTIDVVRMLELFAAIKNEAPEIYNYTTITKREVSGFKEGVYTAIMNYFMLADAAIIQMLTQNTAAAFENVKIILNKMIRLRNIDTTVVGYTAQLFKAVAGSIAHYLNAKESYVFRLLSENKYSELAETLNIFNMAISLSIFKDKEYLNDALQALILHLEGLEEQIAGMELTVDRPDNSIMAYTILEEVNQWVSHCVTFSPELANRQSAIRDLFENKILSVLETAKQNLQSNNLDIVKMALIYIDNCQAIDNQTIADKLDGLKDIANSRFANIADGDHVKISSALAEITDNALPLDELVGQANIIKTALELQYSLYINAYALQPIEGGLFERYMSQWPTDLVNHFITELNTFRSTLQVKVKELSVATVDDEQFEQLKQILQKSYALLVIDKFLDKSNTYKEVIDTLNPLVIASAEVFLKKIDTLLDEFDFITAEAVLKEAQECLQMLGENVQLAAVISGYRDKIDSLVKGLPKRYELAAPVYAADDIEKAKDEQHYYLETSTHRFYVNNELGFVFPSENKDDVPRVFTLNFSKLTVLPLKVLFDKMSVFAARNSVYQEKIAELSLFISNQLDIFLVYVEKAEVTVTTQQIDKLNILINSFPDELKINFEGKIAKINRYTVGGLEFESRHCTLHVNTQNGIEDLLKSADLAYQYFTFHYLARIKSSVETKITDLLDAILDFNKENIEVIAHAGFIQHNLVYKKIAEKFEAFNNAPAYIKTLFKLQDFTISAAAKAKRDELLQVISTKFKKSMDYLNDLNNNFETENSPGHFKNLKFLKDLKDKQPEIYKDLVALEPALKAEEITATVQNIANYYSIKQKRFLELLTKKEVTQELKDIMHALSISDSLRHDTAQYLDDLHLFVEILQYQEIVTTFIKTAKIWSSDITMPLFEEPKVNSNDSNQDDESDSDDDYYSVNDADTDAGGSNYQVRMAERLRNLTAESNLSRNNFYKNIHQNYVILQNAEQLQLPGNITTANIVDTLSGNLLLLKNYLDQLLNEMPTHNVAIYRKFNVGLDNLRACREFFKVESLQDKINIWISALHTEFQTKLKALEDVKPKQPTQHNQVADYVNRIVEIIIPLKAMAFNIPPFKVEIDALINRLLTEVEELKIGNDKVTQAIPLLSLTVKKQGVIGRLLIKQHPALEGFALSLLNAAMLKEDPEKIVKKLTGTDVDDRSRKVLLDEYAEFKKLYDSLVTAGLAEEDLEDKVLPKIVAATEKIVQENGKNKVRELLAHLFSYWTLANSMHYKRAKQLGIQSQDLENYLLKPHPAQIFAIFRLFEMDKQAGLMQTALNMLGSNKDPFEHIANNLAQIGTGEGKSVTIAMTLATVALMGYPAHCACYSPNLSSRDYAAFKPIFDAFKVTSLIKYGTYQEQIEHYMKQEFNVRENLGAMLRGENNTSASAQAAAEKNTKPIHLSIDEVDAFFTSAFFGSAYQMVELIKDSATKILIDFMWKNRANAEVIKNLHTTREYKACLAQFPGWEKLMKHAIINMKLDLLAMGAAAYKPDYRVNEGKIGYIDQDSVSYNQIRGYRTMWAYYREHYEKNNPSITNQTLTDVAGFYINCGSFSYFKMMQEHKHINGVTGTLASLYGTQQQLLQDEFNIVKNSFIPSTFGDKSARFSFDPKKDFVTVDDNKHFSSIVAEIATQMVSDRAILIFFESEDKLNAFYNSDEFKAYHAQTATITEGDDPAVQEVNISAAAMKKKITLATVPFSRGADYICMDDDLDKKGGMQVLSTFIPATEADEEQTKGRTARQGGKGSYKIIASKKELEEKYQISNTGIEAQNSDELYTLIAVKRQELAVKKFAEDKKNLELIIKDHDESFSFINTLKNRDPSSAEAAMKFLIKQNKSPGKKTRTVICLDGTGSMTTLLNQAKANLKIALERVDKVLLDNDLDPELAEKQILVYRNYSSDPEYLLQVSAATHKPKFLQNFLDTIRTEGGQGNEAIEVPFHYINGEIARARRDEKIVAPSQIILIGDAAPNTKIDTLRKRASGIASLSNRWTIYTPESDKYFFEDELKKLVVAKVPVQAVYLRQDENSTHFNESNEYTFKSIASQTGGEAIYLSADVNNYDYDAEKAAKDLTDIIAKNILLDVGGEELVKCYDNTKWAYTGSSVAASSSSSSSVGLNAGVFAAFKTASASHHPSNHSSSSSSSSFNRANGNGNNNASSSSSSSSSTTNNSSSSSSSSSYAPGFTSSQ